MIISSTFSLLTLVHAQNVISGKVVDQTTNQPVFGATIYIPDLKAGAVADTAGKFLIKNIPRGSFLAEIRFIGYESKAVTLMSAPNPDYAIVTLSLSPMETRLVVVTGTSHATEIRKTPFPIVSISKNELQQNSSTNVVDAIAKLPGVNAVTTGPNVSKPYIRGLGYNRILTLYDGIRQEGQQWGDEHGIEIDQYAVDRVEVIKGPASLMYGSDAIAGVVNFLPPDPLPDSTIQGNMDLNYQSNNRLFAGSASLAGNTHGIIWGARFTKRIATNYQDKNDGRVYGTSFNETDANAFIGVNKSWGYSFLNFSLYDDLQAIPDGSRDSLTRKFTKQITEEDTARPIVSDAELNSYKIPVLHQHVQYYRAYLSNNFIFGESKLAVKISCQESVRREFSHPLYPDLAGLFLQLQSYTYDVKYYFPQHKGWDATVGMNGMFQQNTNKGTEFIIPDYHSFDIGPFAFIAKTISKFTIAAGLRYDTRIFNNKAMYVAPNPVTGFEMEVAPPDTTGATNVFYDFKKTFSGISGSGGMTYNFNDHLSVKTNVARGFRAPNISEISANGVHPGTNIYQVGNRNFKPEFSLEEDFGILLDLTHVSGSVEIFNNAISNYIFNQKLQNSRGQDSVIVPGNQTFKFVQSKAQLYGGEISFDIHPHPLDWLHFENSASLVYAINKGGGGIVINDSNKYLPFIPPFHTNSDFRVDFKKAGNRLSGLFVKFGVQYYAAQNKVLLADNTETPTPGYTLFDAGFGGNITNKKGTSLFSFALLCTNLTDVAYQSNMSRLKYMDNYPVNGTGRSGIYNMGRNISVKISVPLDLQHPKSAGR